jgi:hypothetical protein
MRAPNAASPPLFASYRGTERTCEQQLAASPRQTFRSARALLQGMTDADAIKRFCRTIGGNRGVVVPSGPCHFWAAGDCLAMWPESIAAPIVGVTSKALRRLSVCGRRIVDRAHSAYLLSTPGYAVELPWARGASVRVA